MVATLKVEQQDDNDKKEQTSAQAWMIGNPCQEKVQIASRIQFDLIGGGGMQGNRDCGLRALPLSIETLSAFREVVLFRVLGQFSPFPQIL